MFDIESMTGFRVGKCYQRGDVRGLCMSLRCVSDMFFLFDYRFVLPLETVFDVFGSFSTFCLFGLP